MGGGGKKDEMQSAGDLEADSTIVYETVALGTCHHASVKTHQMYNLSEISGEVSKSVNY